MTADAGAAGQPVRRSQPWPGRWLEVILITLLFALYAGQLPPDVNESHYLAKAKHSWDTTWCSGDLFLESANAHWLFYQSIRGLNAWFTLPTVAWIGRVIGWLLLAIGWQRLSSGLIQGPGKSILTAAVFLWLNHQFHLAGEWVVGGIEAKVLAYGLVCWGLGERFHGNGWLSWLLLGLATAFHVLVGGWTWVAIGLGWLAMRWFLGSDAQAFNWRREWPAMLGGLAIALLGIVPPLLANAGVASADLELANLVHVQQRIGHHLDFQQFPVSMVARFSVMTLVFVTLSIRQLQTRPENSWRWMIGLGLGSLLISLVGLSLSAIASVSPEWNVWAAGWLKYYWFRLADFSIPASVALLSLSDRWGRPAAIWFQRAWVGVALVALMVSIAQRYQDLRPRADLKSLPTYPDDPERTRGTFENWKKVCRWIRENTPSDAQFLTPADQQTFKWYAQRAEVFNWKDVPQDVEGIVEWERRFQEVYQPQKRFELGLMSYSDDQLIKLGERFEADYLLVPQRQVDLMPSTSTLEQCYPVDRSFKSTYVVYRLRPRSAD